MAGYLFTLDSIESLHQCVEHGVYGTLVSEPRGCWREPAEGTFADYATMQPGDNGYFFKERAAAKNHSLQVELTSILHSAGKPTWEQ